LLTAAVAAWIALAAACAAAADLVFAVTEGITYYQTNKEIAARFQPLTELLAKALKRPVRIVIVSAYDDLRAGLSRQEYDLAFVHPAHVALGAVKAGKYKSVAWTVGYTDCAVSMLINKDKQMIASTKLSADDEQQIHGVLLGLAQSDAGRNALTTLGYKGFVDPSRDEEPKAIAWLGL
jgi:ABC-type phosphate/phosphonate transport system substrate-binding protein